MSNKPKSRRSKESKASKTQRVMGLDLFEQTVCAVDTREPVASLSYDDNSIYLDLHATLPALKEEIAKDGRQLVYLGNRGQPVTTKEWEAQFEALDLSNRSLLMDSAIARKLYDLPEPENARERSWTMVVPVKEGELAEKGLIPA
ncbi:MAG: hypothetical protein ABSH41_14265 [Syntrophobacteraceae bacterium]